MGKEIVQAAIDFKGGLTHPAISCERCVSSKPALYIVRSELMHLRVCEQCASEARRLRLAVEPMNSSRWKG